MNDKQPIQPLWGAEAIAKKAGLKLRKTFYLLEKGILPARKVGGSWLSTETEIDDFLLGRPSPSERGAGEREPVVA